MPRVFRQFSNSAKHPCVPEKCTPVVFKLRSQVSRDKYIFYIGFRIKCGLQFDMITINYLFIMQRLLL